MIPLSCIEDYLSDQSEGMRGLITWFLNLVMQTEVLHQAGAEAYERTDSRLCYRNGSKDRSLVTRFGDIW